MIKLDPDSRIRISEDHTFPVIVVIIIVLAVLGGGFFYWYYMPQKQDHSAVYAQLGIVQLPTNIERQPPIQSRLDQLGREPCYKDAIIGLSRALLESGYPRESANGLLSFAKRCGTSEVLLRDAYEALVKVGDFSAAVRVADELVKADSADATYRYMRAEAFEQVKDFEHALIDYINSLQLLGNPSRVIGYQFTDISRMYAALGRYCDAITPIETYIAFEPATRRTTQTTKIIAEYAEKGNCDTSYARGVCTNGTSRRSGGSDTHSYS
jgi:tetratricopeptide (TPR) repeat protein